MRVGLCESVPFASRLLSGMHGRRRANDFAVQTTANRVSRESLQTVLLKRSGRAALRYGTFGEGSARNARARKDKRRHAITSVGTHVLCLSDSHSGTSHSYSDFFQP